MKQLAELMTLTEIEKVAESTLPHHVATMLAGGFNDENTYNRTKQVLDEIALRPRRLSGVSDVDCSTSVLGTPVSVPVLPSPAAPHFACHPDAELAVTRAASRNGTIQIVPHMGYWSYTDNAQTTETPLWAQAFFHRDREQMRELLNELERNSYEALVLTVDTPSLNGRREQELRLPATEPGQETSVEVSNALEKVFERLTAANDASQSWEYVDWVCSHTSLPIVLKGILRADMAEKAYEHGARGIIVSSHGSRLFDGQAASIEVLPEIVDAVAGRMETYVDGGIRTGSDIAKVLALGAQAVLIGRPVFYGLAAGGEEGVSRTLDILKSELQCVQRIIGRASVEDISYDDIKLLRRAVMHTQ